MKKRSFLKSLLVDLLCAGLALVIFALFHHVLPRQRQSLGIVIPNPYRTEDAGASDSQDAELPPAASIGSESLTASAGMSDLSLSAKGSRNGRGGSGSRGGGSSKGGSALEDGDETEQNKDATPIAEKFADMYTEETVVTPGSYTSPNVSVTVTEETLDNGRVTYYLADIYLRDVTAFQTALARNTYGSGYRDGVSDMAALSNALVAVNGDYYGNTNEGVVIRNGVIYRANPTDCDVCVLYYDGSMRVMSGSSFSVEDAIADGAWQAWTFGPALLDGGGNAIDSFSSTGRIISANPRTAIGYYEPGHYCLVVVDGRGDSAGITLPRLSELFEDLGCAAAYNLDGGNSSVMVWQGDVINDPSGGGRESSDAVLIAEVN